MYPRPTLFLPLLAVLSFLVSQHAAVASPVVKRTMSSLELRVVDAVRNTFPLEPLKDTLLRRDVIVPKITSPDSNTVWPIGTRQVVTWDTSDFPPDEQITNPLGKVILGRDTGDSLNLDFDHPLAEGFKLRDGQVTIIVPTVPPRNDYLIVLMGDSGNTSPSFAITSISGQPNLPLAPAIPTESITGSVTGTAIPGTIPNTPPILSSTTITEPIPISGTTITGGVSTQTSFPTRTRTSGASESETETSGSATATSGTPGASGTSAPSQSDTSAAGKVAGAWTMAVGVVVATIAFLL